MAVTSELIEQMATMLQDIRPEPARVPELAREVDRLNGAIVGAARSLTLDDDPAAHAALLAKSTPR